MKKITLLLAVLALAVAQAWAAPVIEVDAEKVDFGQVDVGYPVTERFMVSGYDLTDDINLALTGRYAAEYEVTPATITPEAAAAGVIVKVTYSPSSVWSTWATLVLSSADADDVTVSIVADPQRNGTIIGNNNQRNYTAAVGMVDYSVEVANFADAEIPTDPNQPVVRSWGPVSDNYEISIEGDDCFHARIVKASEIAKTCTVRISYSPMASGSHHATLVVTCHTAGVPDVRVQLNGTATLPAWGDLDGDGRITVADVTNEIDVLMEGRAPSSQADVDGDGNLSIRDVSSLIDMLTGIE